MRHSATARSFREVNLMLSRKCSSGRLWEQTHFSHLLMSNYRVIATRINCNWQDIILPWLFVSSFWREIIYSWNALPFIVNLILITIKIDTIEKYIAITMTKINFKTFLNCKISNTVSQLQSAYKNNSVILHYSWNYTLSTGEQIYYKMYSYPHEQCFAVPSKV